MFKKAIKHEAKLRMALGGPSGSGKTYTALTLAKALGGKIALLDSERGSASKYADLFEFDVAELESHHPQKYISAIKEAEQAGYDVLIIDSLSHAWAGKEGALELVDQAKRKHKDNSYIAWGDVTPLQNKLIDTITAAKVHIIATLRTKMGYVLETNSQGKQVPRKVGMEAIQRDGVEYEFDIYGEMDYAHTLSISKSRCPALADQNFSLPGPEIASTLKEWLKGVPQEQKPEQHSQLEATEHPVSVEGIITKIENNGQKPHRLVLEAEGKELPLFFREIPEAIKDTLQWPKLIKQQCSVTYKVTPDPKDANVKWRVLTSITLTQTEDPGQKEALFSNDQIAAILQILEEAKISEARLNIWLHHTYGEDLNHLSARHFETVYGAIKDGKINTQKAA